jgi:prevent-host-death family protein
MIGTNQSSSTEGRSVKLKTIPALEARTQFGQIMKEVQGGQVRVLVEKSGVPMVGIISAQEFQRVIAEREARFEVVDRIRHRLPSIPDSEVQHDVREALSRARRRRRA